MRYLTLLVLTSSVLAFVAEAACLIVSSVDRRVFFSALAAASLGLAATWFLAPWVLLVGWVRGRNTRLGSWASLLVAGILMGAASTWLLVPWTRRLVALYWGISLLTAGAASVIVWLTRQRPRSNAALALLLLLISFAAFDFTLPGHMYRELHDVACMLMFVVGAGLATLAPRRWFETARVGSSVMNLAALLALTVLLSVLVQTASHHWRFTSLYHGRYGLRAERLLQTVFDWDRDGFSNWFSGGDCNDADDAVHPLAVDVPGAPDANCNGATPPRVWTPESRGLNAPSGQAALSSGAVDHVLLLSVDSMRFDVVVSDLMPHLTEFAKNALVLERCYAAASGTQGSLPLLLRPEAYLDSVAEMLADHRIRRFAVVPLEAELVGPGFERHLVGQNEAPATVKEVKKLLRAHVHERVFLWAHFMDPHAPYELHEEVSLADARVDLPAGYRSELGFLDRALGNLFRELVDSGRLERTAIVLTSDHGEALGEHGIGEHGVSGYDSVLRVPCLIYSPELPPGEVRQLGSHRDIPATLLGLFGLHEEARAAERFGRSWLRVAHDRKRPLRKYALSKSARFSSGRKTNGELWILTGARYKLVVSPEENLQELFDLQLDPGETRNLAAQEPEVLQRMRFQLAMMSDLDRYGRLNVLASP